MNPAHTGGEVYCPECGATNWSGRKACWLCAHPLHALSAGQKAARLPQPGYQERARFQYGISSMLLLMTLTAVLLGTFQIAPGLGIVAAVLIVPALLPTCLAAMRRGAQGKPMTTVEKAATLLVWSALMLVVIMAAAAAFFVACLAGLTTGSVELALGILGPIGALVVGIFLYVLFVRRIRF